MGVWEYGSALPAFAGIHWQLEKGFNRNKFLSHLVYAF